MTVLVPTAKCEPSGARDLGQKLIAAQVTRKQNMVLIMRQEASALNIIPTVNCPCLFIGDRI